MVFNMGVKEPGEEQEVTVEGTNEGPNQEKQQRNVSQSNVYEKKGKKFIVLFQ